MTKIIHLSNYVKRQDFEEVLDALCDVTLELAKRVEIKSEEVGDEYRALQHRLHGVYENL